MPRLESDGVVRDPGDTSPIPSPLLQERYGPGYFRGENSGFSRDGYENAHATWRHWMDFVRAEVGAGARWVDVGCAYGFLVAEACESGFRAVGFDASRFAAGQAAQFATRAAGRVACAHGERLPVAGGAVDVVTAFDVLEHVPCPELLVAEAARVLRSGGLFLAATPDPLHFDRHEPTHVAERVPSWWVRTLERNGFSVALRFFQAPFNLELVARKGGGAPIISFDGLGASDPVLEVAGSDALHAALRSGFSAPLDDRARIVSDGALVYLLNAGPAPLAISIEIETASPVAIKLQLDGRVIARIPGGAGEPIPATGPRRCATLLPAGGHTLRIAVEGGWARLTRLGVAAAPADRDELLTGLPFDLYERYALAAEAITRCDPGARRLLDLGGTMGGDAGHLAWAGDFFPDLEVRVADTRAADLPEHTSFTAGDPLPFPDRSFDVVVSTDVLEHVAPEHREFWLAEAWRVAGRWLLLCNPFATAGVADADRYLFEFIRARYGYEHGFLAEHLAHGHPDLDATRRYFEDQGASVAVLPSGPLPAWILLQTLNAWLSHPEQDAAFPAANRAVNRAVGLAATAEPAYRHLLVVDRLGGANEPALSSLIRPTPADLEVLLASLKGLALLAARPASGGDGEGRS